MKINKVMPDCRVYTKSRTCVQRQDISFKQSHPKNSTGIISSILKWLWGGYAQYAEIMGKNYRYINMHN